MKANIVPIGNSQGIRIPKPLLAQTGIEGEVDIAVENGSIVIRPLRQARAGWDEAFKEMHRRGDDALLDDGSIGLSDWDDTEWQW